MTSVDNIDCNSVGEFRAAKVVSLLSLAGVTVTLSVTSRLESVFADIPCESVRRIVGRAESRDGEESEFE